MYLGSTSGICLRAMHTHPRCLFSCILHSTTLSLSRALSLFLSIERAGCGLLQQVKIISSYREVKYFSKLVVHPATNYQLWKRGGWAQMCVNRYEQEWKKRGFFSTIYPPLSNSYSGSLKGHFMLFASIQCIWKYFTVHSYKSFNCFWNNVRYIKCNVYSTSAWWANWAVVQWCVLCAQVFKSWSCFSELYNGE